MPLKQDKNFDDLIDRFQKKAVSGKPPVPDNANVDNWVVILGQGVWFPLKRRATVELLPDLHDSDWLGNTIHRAESPLDFQKILKQVASMELAESRINTSSRNNHPNIV